MEAITSLQQTLEAAVADAGDGVVYFVQAEDYGPIKIGFTRRHRVKARVANLQSSCPLLVRLTRTFPGTRDLERKLHRHFRHLRIHGEWFWPDEDLAGVAHATPVPSRDVLLREFIRAG